MDPIRSSLQPDGAIEDVLAYHSLNQRNYVGLRVRSVAVRSGETWQTMLWVARAFARGERPVRAPSTDYHEVRFLEGWVEPGSFPAFVKSAWVENCVLGVATGATAEFRACANRELLPANNRFATRAGVSWERQHSNTAIARPSSPLLQFDRPIQSDFAISVGRWLEIGDWHGNSDGRYQHGFLFLPETRARIKGLSGSPEEGIKLDVARGVGFRVPLRIKGYARAGRDEVSIDADVRGRCTRLAVPSGAETLVLYLISKENVVLDWHEEYSHRIQGLRRVLTGGNAPSVEARDLTETISGGETDRVEFKPFVEPGRGKCREVLESVVAFANSHGGAIVIGVNKHGDIEGIEGGLARWGEQPPNGRDRRSAYETRIRDLVFEAVSPTPSITTRAVDISGHQVLVVEVAEGDTKPYEITDSHDIYVRRGATDRHASRDELKTLFGDDRRSPWGRSLGVGRSIFG